MSGVWLVGHGEPERQVERSPVRGANTKPYPVESPASQRDEPIDDLASDAAAALGRIHIHVPQTSNRRVVDIGVDVEPADADQESVAAALDQHLARAVEPVGAVIPVGDEPFDEVEAFRCAQHQQPSDVGWQCVNPSNVCDHDPDRMTQMQRVVVVGSSGSGKTTLARRLAATLGYPLLEMDSVFHAEGWDSTPDDEFKAALSSFSDLDRWVADGNYTSHGGREVIWPRADTVIWVDPPKRVAMRRVIARTLTRIVTREKLWGKVTEPWTNLYSRDPYKNIIVWTWTRFDEVREKYERCMVDGSWGHATVHRLRKRSEVEDFLDSVERDATSTDH